jgi:hypothetical protein
VLLPLQTRLAQVAFAVVLASLAPVCALAATVDASSIPDGTYNAKVQKVVVLLDNGNVTTFVAGRDSIDFTKVQPDDQLKVSLIKGSVMVYADLTSH